MLRALPNLQKLDNVEVTQEEVQDALKGAGQVQNEEVYEDAYTNGAPEQQQYQQPPPQQPPQQQQYQQPPAAQQPPQQQQWRGQSPPREVSSCIIKNKQPITIPAH